MKYFLCLLFATIHFQMNAQEWDKYPVQNNRVIAVPGLNMRTQPNLSGEKIVFIPFGKEVKILSPDQFQIDTVGEIRHFYRDVLQNVNPNPVIDGYWVKARYNGKTGYVFSAYLTDYRRSNRFQRSIETREQFNQDYVLLFEGANCKDNTHYQKDWHYYAAQDVENGICLVPVEMSYVIERQGYADLRTHCNATEFSPKFIIGSRHPLSTNTLNAQVDMTIESEEMKSSPLKIEATGERSAPNLVLQHNGKAQVLNPYTDANQTTKNRFSFLNFIGDLDGDGHNDYIIAYGEKFSQTVLYLSREAGPDQIVKPVAVWYTGYCC